MKKNILDDFALRSFVKNKLLIPIDLRDASEGSVRHIRIGGVKVNLHALDVYLPSLLQKAKEGYYLMPICYHQRGSRQPLMYERMYDFFEIYSVQQNLIYYSESIVDFNKKIAENNSEIPLMFLEILKTDEAKDE